MGVLLFHERLLARGFVRALRSPRSAGLRKALITRKGDLATSLVERAGGHTGPQLGREPLVPAEAHGVAVFGEEAAGVFTFAGASAVRIGEAGLLTNGPGAGRRSGSGRLPERLDVGEKLDVPLDRGERAWQCRRRPNPLGPVGGASREVKSESALCGRR
jgi:hypothetical protein